MPSQTILLNPYKWIIVALSNILWGPYKVILFALSNNTIEYLQSDPCWLIKEYWRTLTKGSLPHYQTILLNPWKGFLVAYKIILPETYDEILIVLSNNTIGPLWKVYCQNFRFAIDYYLYNFLIKRGKEYDCLYLIQIKREIFSYNNHTIHKKVNVTLKLTHQTIRLLPNYVLINKKKVLIHCFYGGGLWVEKFTVIDHKLCYL